MSTIRENILAEIAEGTRKRVALFKERESETALETRAQASRKPHDFRAAFTGAGTHVIAEVKFASPSEGELMSASARNALRVASDYLANGAAALSILTEPHYFKGDLEYLKAVRAAHPDARLLMKDFVVDPYQLALARATGADAVLVLLAMLPAGQSRALFARAKALGLTPLVEVHDEEELKLAADLGADLIGINNRNLKTMKVSLEASERLAHLAPKGATLISESGIKTAADLKKLSALGYRGFLIGTHFMKTQKPGPALRDLLK